MSKRYKMILVFTMFIMFVGGCASPGAYKSSDDGFSKTYFTSFDIAWQAVREALGKKYRINNENKESGIIKTKWYNNTKEKNFTDSFGASDTLKNARIKFTITVAKAFADGRSAVKITIYGRQQLQKDFLEGWLNQDSNGIYERTMLYRIGRMIYIKMKLDWLDKIRADEMELDE